jgi:hypothetical protein
MKNPRTSTLIAWLIIALSIALMMVGIVFAYQFRSITLPDIYLTWQSRLIQVLPFA